MKTIKLNGTLCKGCGICAALCPRQVFDTDLDGKPLAMRVEACVGCKLCELRCPDFAIKVEVEA